MAKRKLDDQDHSTSSQITAMDSSSSSAPRRRKTPNSDHPPPKNPNSPRLHLQFFVKMINDGKTVVLRANLRDTVEKIHRKIYLMTGIPLIDQRLIYRGKQLQLEQTLEECDVENDAGLFLVARLRSTVFLKAWEVISDINNYIRGVCRNVSVYFDCRSVKDKLERFVSLPLEPERCCLGDCDGKIDYCKIFMEARVPQALVTMYLSREKAIRESGDECIQWFVSYVTGLGVTVSDKACCAMMVMEIVRILRRVCADVADGEDDVLYVHCRRVFGMLLKKVEMGRRRNREVVLMTVETEEVIKFVAFEEVFPLLIEVGKKLLNGWVKMGRFVGPVFMDVCDFSIFLQPVLSFIGKEIALGRVSGKCKGKGKGRFSLVGDEFDPLYDVFVDLLTQVDKCLSELGTGMDFEQEQNGWSHYILVLKELNRITVLCPDAENWFWATMRKHKEVVRLLVVQFTTSLGDHTWLIKHKDILDFKSRRHLALLMFPTVGEEYEEFEEMLIDRSQLLAESFEYIYSAEPAYLQAGLFMEFKNEEATGPGVLREWFCLVCQAFFDQRNALFIACPLDRRRFYPNPGKSFVVTYSFFNPFSLICTLK